MTESKKKTNELKREREREIDRQRERERVIICKERIRKFLFDKHRFYSKSAEMGFFLSETLWKKVSFFSKILHFLSETTLLIKMVQIKSPPTSLCVFAQNPSLCSHYPLLLFYSLQKVFWGEFLIQIIGFLFSQKLPSQN